MFLLLWNLISLHAQAIYVHQFVYIREWQNLDVFEIFSLETGIGLRQKFDYKVKLVPLVSIVGRFQYDYDCCFLKNF